MKLEDQVCSLELAKRLKELGVKQESFYIWRSVYAHHSQDKVRLLSADHGGHECDGFTRVSAFTVAELGEMLPETLGGPPNQVDVEQYKYADGYGLQVSEYANGIPHLFWSVKEKIEADARSRMLIYLIEKKLIKTTQEN